MDIEKMKINKKGASSLMGIVFTLIIVMGMFSGMYIFYTDQLSQSDQVLDSKYNQTYQNLLIVQNNLSERVNEIKETADDVEEADNTFLAAINGFKGAGQAILLLLGFTSDSIDTTQALLLSTDVIPSWLQALIVIALITFVIFIVIDVVIGRKPITN